MTITEIELSDLVSELGAKHGCAIQSTSFIKAPHIMIKWRKTQSGLEVGVSDLLDGAPTGVILDYVEHSIFPDSRPDTFYGTEYTEYLRSEDFVLSKRPIVLKRMKTITRSDVGLNRNLFDSVDRLLQIGLLNPEDIQNSVFTWSRIKSTKKLGYCQNIFRIVVISAIFDDPSVPETFLDYVVYHECVHLRIGYLPNCHNYHNAEFRQQMNRFPDSKKVNKELTLFLKENFWKKKYSH